MPKILVIAEHNGAKLNTSTAKTVACAASMDEAIIDVAVFAADASFIAIEAAKLNSVKRVMKYERSENEHSLAAIIAPQIIAIAEEYTHIFAPSTTFGKDLMPRVAALLGVNQISDVMSIESSRIFKRPIYAGNAIETIEIPMQDIVVATIRIASYAATTNGNSATIESGNPSKVKLPTHTRFVEIKSSVTDRPDLQTAAKVVSGGRALASEENFDIIYKLAGKLNAAVGASRAAVDAGYVPNEMQVGQTGKIIAPDLYIAIGISGAIQHLTGIKDAGTIIAINKDAEAPIFEVADIGLVADLFIAVPELIEALN
ncbi:MAG: FAD-binding protein [Woeseiaceae bacterium]|nr:FAD-binding protein [Woeseiaceae bacterium]